MRFTLRQLAYFVAAGETGSVTLASERANISQPSISAAISQLEAEFGLQLFIRHHAQGLSLTPAGKHFLEAATDLLRRARNLNDIADQVAKTVAGPLEIGSFRTYAALLIPELCKTFLEKHPDVRLRVFEGDEASLLVKLRNAEIAVAVTYLMHVTDDLNFEPLAELPTYILLAADHPLAGRTSLRLAELDREPFIMLDLPLSRDYFRSLFKQAGLVPNVVASSEHSETVRSYVGSGLGFSLLTARPLNTSALNGKPLAYVQLEDGPAPMVLGIATLKTFRKTRVVEAFEEHCRALISNGKLPGIHL